MKRVWRILPSVLLCVGVCFASGCTGGLNPHRHQPMRVAAKAATCTEDGNNEYFVCKECRLVFTDKECTARTTVSQQKIAAVGHTYDQAAWGYKGADGHAHVCHCGEADAVLPHVSGGAATENSPETCVDCGFLLTPALSHQHQALPDDGDCTTDVVCSCGETMVTGEAEHRYDNACDGTCNNPECNVERTPAPHVDKDKDGSCDVCGTDTSNNDHDITLPEVGFGN